MTSSRLVNVALVSSAERWCFRIGEGEGGWRRYWNVACVRWGVGRGVVREEVCRGVEGGGVRVTRIEVRRIGGVESGKRMLRKRGRVRRARRDFDSFVR